VRDDRGPERRDARQRWVLVRGAGTRGERGHLGEDRGAERAHASDQQIGRNRRRHAVSLGGPQVADRRDILSAVV
jgi:hypothetical protein